jgi:hypothetical protein
MDQAVDEGGAGAGPERSFARGGKGQHRAQAEHITRRADLVAFGLLGRHESGRADNHAGTGYRARLHGPGDPEVDDPRAIFRHQHVRWLEVTVHQAR